METKMKAPALAKKLRTRIAELKRERVKALAKYDRDFATWKRDVAKWLKTEPQKVIPRITKADLGNSRYGCHTALPNYVFEGIPKPPRKPTDEVIRDIQKTIRYIAFTGAPTVNVTQRQLDEWLGKGEPEEDEESS